jgi:hypothetical protein
MESIDNFKRRVVALTGKSIDELPDAAAEELIGNQIVCVRDGCYVVTQGYPSKDILGDDIYTAWAVVDRARLAEPPGFTFPPGVAGCPKCGCRLAGELWFGPACECKGPNYGRPVDEILGDLAPHKSGPLAALLAR